jgi:RsiW-degrading membrane proteinase PrsW (M82 family)
MELRVLHLFFAVCCIFYLPNTIKPIYFFATFFLMLASILLAQAISLLLGYSTEQFKFSGGFSFTAGIFPAWLMLFLAPVIEEWHGTLTVRIVCVNALTLSRHH